MRRTVDISTNLLTETEIFPLETGDKFLRSRNQKIISAFLQNAVILLLLRRNKVLE